MLFEEAGRAGAKQGARGDSSSLLVSYLSEIKFPLGDQRRREREREREKDGKVIEFNGLFHRRRIGDPQSCLSSISLVVPLRVASKF